jgi:hypothetical protein
MGEFMETSKKDNIWKCLAETWQDRFYALEEAYTELEDELSEMKKIKEGTYQKILNDNYHVNLKFDQLIYEKTWVHISFDPRMRGNILTLKGKGKYAKGIV